MVAINIGFCVSKKWFSFVSEALLAFIDRWKRFGHRKILKFKNKRKRKGEFPQRERIELANAADAAGGQQQNQEAPPEWNAEECDSHSFDDSDRFEEDSLCSWSSEPESLCNNWRGWKRPITASTFGNGGVRKTADGKFIYLFILNRVVRSNQNIQQMSQRSKTQLYSLQST